MRNRSGRQGGGRAGKRTHRCTSSRTRPAPPQSKHPAESVPPHKRSTPKPASSTHRQVLQERASESVKLPDGRKGMQGRTRLTKVVLPVPPSPTAREVGVRLNEDVSAATSRGGTGTTRKGAHECTRRVGRGGNGNRGREQRQDGQQSAAAPTPRCSLLVRRAL